LNKRGWILKYDGMRTCRGAIDGAHGRDKSRSYKGLATAALICFISSAGFWPSSAFAATPVADNAFDAAAKALDKSKEEVQVLKNSWDKTRLETTLYDQRAKRAYQKWLKATKKAKEQAKAVKEQAELELQLAIEKRKLAYNQWQGALLRQMSKESELKALDQDKDTAAVREKIKQLEEKLGKPSSVARPSSSGTTSGGGQ
jgi:hypothetical protein